MDLQRLLHDVDPDLFEFVWGLFDADGDGVVYADDFVAAMALLTTGADTDTSIEEQMRITFVMFDTRGDGRLGCAAATCKPPSIRFLSAGCATAASNPRCV